jgi:hypothetical protein
MPAHKLPAAARARIENLRKANEAKKQKRLERERAELQEKIDQTKSSLEQIPGLIEEKSREAAIDIFAKQAEKTLGKVLKAGALAAWEDAGGGERLRKLLKKDDKFFKDFTVKAMVPLAKSEGEAEGGDRQFVQVNIFGLKEEKNINVNVTKDIIDVDLNQG